MYQQAQAFCFSLVLLSAATLCSAAPPHKAKRPAPPQSKGQKQIAGGDGEFGAVYSLKDTFNFEIVSAHYTVEPVVAYRPIIAAAGEKLVVVDIAIKNAGPAENSFLSNGYLTLVDAGGELYTPSAMVLASRAEKQEDWTLRPGQGLGQPARHDPLQIGMVLPAKARIVKIIVNRGRLNSSEKVLRYFVAGATEAEAGKDGDPRNVIAPLPDNVRDPADSSGATVLGSGKGAAGVFLPSGLFAFRLDSLSYLTGKTPQRNFPEDGKKYAVATITAKSLILDSQSMDSFTNGADLCSLADSDGETDKAVALMKVKSRETPEHDFKQEEGYSFRIVFPLAVGATAKTVTLGAWRGRTWTFPVTAALVTAAPEAPG